MKNRWSPKVVGVLLGKQSVYTKIRCFLCELESRAKDKHYKIKDWPIRDNSASGGKSVINRLLVNRDKIFPPLHIKLRLKNHSFLAMNKYGKCFEY